MKLPDFKAAFKAGLTDVENLFTGLPAEERTSLTNTAVAGIGKLRDLAETEIEAEVAKAFPAFTAPTTAVITEALGLLAEKEQAALTAKVAQIEAAKGELAAAATASETAS